MGLTLLLLRRAGEQLVKDVECPLLVGLPDDPRLLQEVRLCKGGKKNALREDSLPLELLITLPVSSPQTSSHRPLPSSFPVPSLKGPMARIYYWPLRYVGLAALIAQSSLWATRHRLLPPSLSPFPRHSGAGSADLSFTLP